GAIVTLATNHLHFLTAGDLAAIGALVTAVVALAVTWIVGRSLRKHGTSGQAQAGLLVALAFVCFVLAALGIPVGTINLVALGLAFWALALLLPVSLQLVLVLVVLLLAVVLVKLILERPRASSG